LGCSTIPDTQKNAKILTLIIRKVDKSAIRKNTEIICPNSPESDMGGCNYANNESNLE
jgi:hypothetical protein